MLHFLLSRVAFFTNKKFQFIDYQFYKTDTYLLSAILSVKYLRFLLIRKKLEKKKFSRKFIEKVNKIFPKRGQNTIFGEAN